MGKDSKIPSPPHFYGCLVGHVDREVLELNYCWRKQICRLRGRGHDAFVPRERVEMEKRKTHSSSAASFVHFYSPVNLIGQVGRGVGATRGRFDHPRRGGHHVQGLAEGQGSRVVFFFSCRRRQGLRGVRAQGEYIE